MCLILSVLALSLTRVQAADGPPTITQQPTNQTVVSGTSASFSVIADGTPPLSYHWTRNGLLLPGATNATLLLPSVSFTQSGVYSVTVNNPQGSWTSTSALLVVDPQLTFRVTALRTNGAIVVDHNALTGNDRGGIAVSASTVFVTGDNATARFNSEFLTNGVSLGTGTIYDGMLTDLKTETIYLLASGTNIMNSSGGSLDNLVEINGATGLPTGNRIILSTNIVLQYYGETGIFSGYGRVVIHQGYEAYDIRLPSGQVTYLGFTQYLPHNYSDSWAYWGVAEYLGGNLYVLFADYSFPVSAIDRARLPDGEVSRAAGFINFSDMASFIISPSLSRWFFHYQGHGQVGGTTETLGSAKALYSTDPQFPFIYNEPLSQSVYPGSNATLVVSAGGGYPLYYQWQFNTTNIAGATNASYTISEATTNMAGTYSVLVSNSTGTILSGNAFVSVITTPFITQNPSSVLTYPGSNATFFAFGDGAPPVSYQWLFNGVEINGATNSILVLTNLQLSQGGAYSLQLSNVYGEALSEAATLTVRSEPVVLTPPVSRTVNAGNSTTFAVTADGAPPLHYQWSLNGTNIPGATNRSLGLSSLKPAQAGTYTINVSNIYGVISASATLTVITVPTIALNPADQSPVEGDTVSFRVVANGPGPLRYQWRFNGADLTNATNNILQLSNIQAADVGSYAVLVYNSYGSILSSPAALTLFPVHPEGATFRIVSLTASNSKIVEVDNLTGDDHGGIVTSLQNVFLTGDNSTARFGQDLTNGLTLGQVYDTISCNLRNGKIYLLASNDVPFSYPFSSVSSVFTHLLELDTSTGLPSGNRIALSSTIPFSTSSGQCGIFSGFDRILFHNKTNVYGILLPSGIVTNYGAMASPTHSSSESWAYWGVAENYGGNIYIDYVRNSTTISRTRVPDNVTTTLSSFSGLSDMASFTVALYSNRWYFHYENSAQFGGSDETLGYATAVFDVNPVDHFDWAPIAPLQTVGGPFMVTITAKTGKNTIASTFNGVVNLTGTNVTGGGNVPLAPTVTGNFTNGVWTGLLTIFQPSTSMYLQASTSAGNSGISSSFTVLPTNDISVALIDSPDPVPASTLLTYLIVVTNTGPNVATDVLVDDVLPPNITVQSAMPTQGSCTIYTNAIICELGNVAGATGASVSITAFPNLTTKFTNQVTIYRGEADGTLANNSAVAVTTATLPQFSISDARMAEGNSGTNDMRFTVSLFPASTNTLRVNFTMNNITASRDSDFVFRSGTITFLPGETNQSINIGIIGDALYEQDETFSVQLFLPNGGFIGRGLGIGTILNDDPLPAVTIADVNILEGNSGTNAAAFQVVLSGRSSLPITVTCATLDGSARAGSDYIGLTNTLLFAGGTAVLTQTVLIPILGDTLVEPNETFFLNVRSVNNAVFSQSPAVGTIVNDDGIGVLHHFTWSPVATQQILNTSFPVTITARDAVENTMSNFNQTVRLQAGIGMAVDPQHMIDDDNFEFSGTGDFTIGFEFTPSVDITVVAVRHYVGVRVSLWSDLGELLVTTPVDSIYGTWSETPLDFPVKLPAGLPYRVAFYTGNGGKYAYSTNLPSLFGDGTIGSIYYNLGDNYPSNLTGGAFFPVDLVYFPGDAIQPLSLTPTNSGNFVNGSWSGEITLLETGTGVRLFASDDAGHKGQTGTFDVIGNTLRISGVRIVGNDVRVSFQGAGGTNYRLEKNDDLEATGWSMVTSFTPSANQTVELIDPGGATAPSRFYRIKAAP
jgi:uncharacterized repeat protein (TIGR01451 family)